MYDADARVHEAHHLAELGAALFAGKDPEVQGAALAELLALFLSGHPPGLRDLILSQHIMAVRGLVELEDKQRASA